LSCKFHLTNFINFKKIIFYIVSFFKFTTIISL
jgi:hypothetical protein